MLNKKVIYIINSAVAWFSLLLYLSMHTMLGFIGHVTFSALPYILGVLIAASAVTSLVLTLWKQNKVLLIVTMIFNAIAFAGSLAYFFGLLTHYKAFLTEMGKLLILYIFIAIVIYLIFYFPKGDFKGKKIVAGILCAILIGGAVLGFTDFDTLRINYLTEGAAVYAVGEDYQIVWTTRAKGIGWVEIGGMPYYDEYAGSKRSNEKVHKVTVPQSVLDEAKGYTIKSKAMLSEQGYSGLLGYTVKKEYAFRPVDTSDGIQAYAVSDTHDYNSVVKKTASFYGENLDFVVMAGDIVSFLATDSDLRRILNLANALTGGSRPVIFARGNHELKSVGAEDLHRYAGSDGEKFYYTFRLQNVWGVVLDMGEDHADDWYEFYDTAIYDGYRQAQIEFLDEIIDDKDNEYAAEGVEYRIGVSHVSTAISSFKENYMFDALAAINERLNQMNLDVMLSGHLHENFKIEAGYETGRPLFYHSQYTEKTSDDPVFLATGANYPSILCSRRSDVQSTAKKENVFGRKFIGAALEFNAEKTVRYTNAKNEVLFTVSPFENIDYGKIILL